MHGPAGTGVGGDKGRHVDQVLPPVSAGLPSSHPSLCVLDWRQGPGFADGPLLIPHPFPPQRTVRSWPQFSACQRIQSKGNVKHCRHCVLELGKLSTPQFTLLSETASLTTEQSPGGPGPRHCSPPRAAYPRGDPPLLLQPQTPHHHSLWLLAAFLLASSCVFPPSRLGRRPGSTLLRAERWAQREERSRLVLGTERMRSHPIPPHLTLRGPGLGRVSPGGHGLR